MHMHMHMHRYEDYMSRWHPSHAREQTLDAAGAYADIAGRAGLSPTALSILWCRTRPFVEAHGSVIIGMHTPHAHATCTCT